jgi:hypothetical protein
MTQATSPVAEDENQAPVPDEQGHAGGAPPQPEAPKKGAFEDWRLACAAAIGATVALFANPFGKRESAQQKEERARALGPRPLWPIWVATAFAAVCALVVLWIIFRPRPDVWTDDAYVTAHFALIAPRVSGQVTNVEVDDNQQVKPARFSSRSTRAIMIPPLPRRRPRSSATRRSMPTPPLLSRANRP